jgi:4-oxalocrotonate tautomerase family enzyme
MPVITYDGNEMDSEMKKAMIKALTDAVVNIVPGIPRSAYYVFIREHPNENIGVGGYVLDEHLERMEAGTL